jgi:hypothetical protein
VHPVIGFQVASVHSIPVVVELIADAAGGGGEPEDIPNVAPSGPSGNTEYAIESTIITHCHKKVDKVTYLDKSAG